MFVELAIAAVAAIVWSRTDPGARLNTIAYNVMFIASVSTLLFNANPLLRFDGYYILSDLLEIANLAPRSRQYLYYLTKRYAWAVRNPHNPANTAGERFWLPIYGIASTLYRVFICSAILLFVAGKFFILGAALALTAVVTWVFVPLGKFVHYLATSGELARVRPRAVLSTLIVLVAIFTAIGLIPAPDRSRVEGVVEPVQLRIIYMKEDGFVTDFMPSEQKVSSQGPPLVTAQSRELETQQKQLQAEGERLKARRRLAQTKEVAAAQIFARQIAALDKQITRVDQQIRDLKIHAPPISAVFATSEFSLTYVNSGGALATASH
jgi:putative peptide zinc metalloprotease protein